MPLKSFLNGRECGLMGGKNTRLAVKRPGLESGGWPRLHTVVGLRASPVMPENPLLYLAFSLGTSHGVV